MKQRALQLVVQTSVYVLVAYCYLCALYSVTYVV